MNCRACGHLLRHEFIDLGQAPASNSFLTKEQLPGDEPKFPLKLFVCEHCFLVQIDEYKKSNEIFGQDYVYFSSYSRTWLEHAKRYVDMISKMFSYDSHSRVIELASNDGYLLQYFKEKHIPVLGIEPSASVASAAQARGIETIIDFFGLRLGQDLVKRGVHADLLIANNVLAHVADIHDFVGGMKILLKETGVITAEFPYLLELIENNQFDTIYQEHYSYFSFHAVMGILARHGLAIFDVESLPTHGGSLRIYAKHEQDISKKISSRVSDLLRREKDQGMLTLDYYKGFKKKVEKVKIDLLKFLKEQKFNDKTVVAYGAAAKGNTLLNYCGVKEGLIRFVVDASEHKQGKFLPGSHIPVVSEKRIRELRPEYILILPWNIKDEIVKQLSYVRDWKAQFVLPIPRLEVF